MTTGRVGHALLHPTAFEPAENPCRMRGYGKEQTAERAVGSVSAVIALSDLLERRHRRPRTVRRLHALGWREIVALRGLDLDLEQGTVRVARKFAELQDGRRGGRPSEVLSPCADPSPYCRAGHLGHAGAARRVPGRG